MKKIFQTSKILFAVAAFLILYFLTPQFVSAATLYLSSDKEVVNIGETLEVIIKIDSEDVGINAAQATLQFPKDILEVKNLDKSDSIFNFWLEEPAFSNEDGKVTFIGGSSFGSSGKSLKVLKAIFKVKGSGQIKFVFTDGAITVSDGSGTNVLSVMLGLELTSVPKAGVGEPGLEESPSTQIPPPTQITRQPVIVQKLPIKPVIKVPLYPDPEKWYNSTANFMVQWELPADVSGVNTALDQNISYSNQKTDGLFESKVFPIITDDGVWYLHVRFKNNVGWGPAARYRLAIDTAPPLGFLVTSLEGEATDNPTPSLQFKTSDALSGLKEYQVKIGDDEAIKIPAADFDGLFQLPLQSPEKRQIMVRAIDEAGNSVDSVIFIDILPIASPTITFVTKELFSDEDKGLNIKGTALPNTNVLLIVLQKDALIANSTIRADEKGNWEFTFDQPLRNGKYILTIQSQDERGALSLVVKSPEVRVKNKPIIQICGFQLGMGVALILLLLIIAVGFGGGVWFYKKRQGKLALRRSVVKTDMAKVFKLIQDDIEKLQQATVTPTEADDEFMAKRLQENIKKMEGYLKKEIERLK
jgi:hypothetical protein